MDEVIAAYKILKYIKMKRKELDELEAGARHTVDLYMDHAMPGNLDSMVVQNEGKALFKYTRTHARKLNQSKLKRDYPGIHEACIQIQHGTKLEILDD